MLDPSASLAGPAVHTVVSWLGTYFVHSTVLVGGVWAFTRFLPLDSLTRSLLWKMSLVGGLFTATLQTGLGVQPLFGSVSVEAGSTVQKSLPPPPTPPLATVAAPPPPQVRESSAPVLVQHTHGCVGCEPKVLVVSDEGLTAVFAAPAHVRVEHAAIVEAPAMFVPAALPAPPSPPLAAAAPAVPPVQEAGAAVWLLAGLFLLGATASLGRLGATAVRLRRGLRGRTPLRQGPLRERLARLLTHARVPQDSVRLTMSERVGSPIALASREIVVPARVHALAPRQQEAMLAHELAHVLRRDPAWQVLASVLEAVLFFQPLNRVARRGMQEAAEELCDDWAVRHTGSGLHLARCLTEVAGWPGRSDMSHDFASPMAGKSSLLVRRVQRLLDAETRERGRWARRWRGLLGAALLAMVGLGAPGLSLSVARADDPEPPVAPELPDDPPLMPEPVFEPPPPPQPSMLGFVPPLPPQPALLEMPAIAPTAPVLAVAPVTASGEEAAPARQRRAQRRAERLERKAEPLRTTHSPVPPATPPAPPRAPLPPTPPSPPDYAFAYGGDTVVYHDHDDCSDDHDASPPTKVVVVPRNAERLVRDARDLAVRAKVIDAKQLRDLERAAAAIAKQASKLDAAKIEALKARAEGLARRASHLSPEQLKELSDRAEKIAADVEKRVSNLDLSGLADALEDLDLDDIADDVEREVERSLRASGHVAGSPAGGWELRRIEREHKLAANEARRQVQQESRRVERERARAEADARRAANDQAKKANQARVRAGEAVRREVERALRDNVIDADEQRRIEEAARKAGEVK
ncbi:M56 family metallopeptidase [Nannocystis pusilla]|uniref:M48 family metalloprotease n=1 Tax=Nannocystis pusilla TaxID=889268 RepID=A0ABS7TS77_9BACT|nr:M56 family metallopeptidase [Nannocystis pusilla]MBZ5711040.1 M48 family metalloprotease [Nannocystis pusilla]